MGFQDRDYNRYEPYGDDGYHRPRRRGGAMSVTMRLVFINVAFWLVNGFFFNNNLLTRLMTLTPDLAKHPDLWWKFLTYGFAHDPTNIWHIVGNMLSLIMFGYGAMLGIGPGGFGIVRGENVEQRLGRTEYFFFYTITIIFSGIIYALVHPAQGCLGASGGVTGVVVLFALLYPHKTMMIFPFPFPIPMWMLGVFIVAYDAFGYAGNRGGVAFAAHLAGAAFAVYYYFVFIKSGGRIINLFSDFFSFFKHKRKPKLKVFDGEEPKKKPADEAEFEKKLDAILDRYGKVGESGLTREEREFLQYASKKYRDKHKQ
ncbi:MAG: rhomboid family intramembrane serine protease [Planctomycetaceae bacterium]|jgi:membrane associated rhomboid family serine protease|nr:rhomboid family intramembrane serine protease [Planctomycetaceae bacterium]